MEKSEVCYIRAKQKRDYIFDGIKNSGYDIVIPYKDYNLVLRLLREAWFRLRLPCRRIWYNGQIKRLKGNYVVIGDPLITQDFLRYVRELFPQKKLIFEYNNRVSRYFLSPDKIRRHVNEIWSYDADDCEKYGLRLKKNSYLDIYATTPDERKQYDVLYLGRDKGRLETLEKIENELKGLGLKTLFYICADRFFLIWKNKRYRRLMPYEDYLELLKKSRAILNIVPEGQRSVTQREMEAVFDGVKCVTNNKGILDFPLYDPSRFYLMENGKVGEGVKAFLDEPFKPIPAEALQTYRFDNRLAEMIDTFHAE